MKVPPQRTSVSAKLKRILKYLLLFLFALLMLVAAGIFSIYAKYRSVVNAKPGGLEVSAQPGEFGKWVDPFIGTGGVPWVCAYNSPAAMRPFGMIRLGPDTASLLTATQGLNASGYYYGDNKIVGFSHTRLLGADALEGGHFRVTPTIGSLLDSTRSKERFPKFSHREEVAFPGYYAVRLPQEDVLAELTTTPRVGIHRYTFRKQEKPHLLLEVTSALGNARAINGSVRIFPEDNRIEGAVRTYGSFAGRYDGLDVYFAARLDTPLSSFEIWNEGKIEAGADMARGNNVLVDLAFEPQGAETVVELRLAISYTGLVNARTNLEAEAANRSFEEIQQDSAEAWEEKLSRIRVEGGTEKQKRIFYTALCRAFQMPTTFNDTNGDYRGLDKDIHRASGFTYYTDFSLWDTFRTVHPLYNLIAREEQREMMLSLLEMAKAGGAFPRWPAGCGYTNCMFGTPADMAVTEAYLKGIRGFDIEAAYGYLRQTAITGKPSGTRFAGRERLEAYQDFGYCPSDKMSKAVAQTLEFSWADYSLSLLARELGRHQDADELEKQSQSYRNLWNPETQYFQPKDSEGVFQPIDPLLLSYTDREGILTNDYAEGSALQWRWAVPFDPEGLISLFDSKETFISELEAYFENTTEVLGKWNPGPYYWQGNEPYFHAAYLFNSAGRPDLTQKWVRWIMEKKYNDDYVGLDGNDDGGTLSAWYVLSALGIYPIAGTTRYEIGSPIFDRAVLVMGEATLEIVAENQGPENLYVEEVKLNGAPIEIPRFNHDAIAGGGAILFNMTSTPPTASTQSTSYK
jgi:predicted alpha-1,2-mannosidase